VYVYDRNGNRVGSGYQVGPGNEVLSNGVWNYKYDLAGNLVEKDGIGTGLVWRYTWDDANHLLSAVEYDSRGQVVVREVNHWDVFGNLLAQEVYSGATGQTRVTRYARHVAGLSEAALSQARVGDRLRESGEPGGGAARIQEMSVSHDPWQVYRRRRWIARVCLLLLIIPGTCLHNILLEHEKMNPVAAFCLSWGILLVIFLFFI
jgi:hypothetical protein